MAHGVGGRRAALPIPLFLLLLYPHAGGGSAQCFQSIHPPPSDLPYELDESEYDELPLLFNINCEPLPFAESMTVQSADRSSEIL